MFGADFSDSVRVVQRLLSGKVPGLPRLGFTVVDVRDVADLHIRAMTDPAAAGQRFIAVSRFIWIAEMAALMRERLGDQARRTPTAKIPNTVMRLASLFDRDLAAATGDLGRRKAYMSAKARSLLGWRPRSHEDVILDCARDLIERRLV